MVNNENQKPKTSLSVFQEKKVKVCDSTDKFEQQKLNNQNINCEETFPNFYEGCQLGNLSSLFMPSIKMEYNAQGLLNCELDTLLEYNISCSIYRIQEIKCISLILF